MFSVRSFRLLFGNSLAGFPISTGGLDCTRLSPYRQMERKLAENDARTLGLVRISINTPDCCSHLIASIPGEKCRGKMKFILVCGAAPFVPSFGALPFDASPEFLPNCWSYFQYPPVQSLLFPIVRKTSEVSSVTSHDRQSLRRIP